MIAMHTLRGVSVDVSLCCNQGFGKASQRLNLVVGGEGTH